MNNINCNIIRDILPLYTDNVVSEDTKILVESHLENCSDCTRILNTMRTTIVIPPQTDELQVMQQFKFQWTWKKYMQGLLSALLLVALVVLVFLFLYGVGLPTRSDNVLVRTGFQCQIHNPEDWDTAICPTGEQIWIMDTSAVRGDIRGFAQYQYETINGKQVATGVVEYMTVAPFRMPWDGSGAVRAGYDWPEDLPTTEEYDFTVTLVFLDKTVTYSLREEGILEEPHDHTSEFCVAKMYNLREQAEG